jgi:dienelactone hydrolase
MAYGKLPAIEDMAISPSGDNLAVVAQTGERRDLILLDAQRKERSRVALGNLKMRDLDWVGEDDLVMMTSSTERLPSHFTAAKYEFFNAIILRKGASQVEPIFGGRKSIMPAIQGDYGSRLVDGKWEGFYGGIEFSRTIGTGTNLSTYAWSNRGATLFGVGIADGSLRRAAPPAESGHLRGWLIDGNGQVAATLDIKSVDGHWTILNSQRTVLATGVDPAGDIGLTSLGRDGTTAIYGLEDPATGKTRVFEVPLAGGQPTEILADADVAGYYIDGTNGRLLGYLPRDGEAKPVMFDPAQQNALRKVYRAFPKLRVTIKGWTPSFSHILVQTRGNGDSGTWYVVEMAQFKAFTVGAERPDISPDQVGPISTVAYTAADGLQMSGILTLPPGLPAKNLPVVLLPHGGPQSHDVATFDWWAQAFASRGYAVFQPNFRGSTNRDDAFRRAGYGQWGRKMQTDISDGLAELARQGIVDPKRACIVGASYGGYAALAGVTLQQGLYRCAVAVAPVSDLTDMYTTNYRESGQDKMVGVSLRESLGNPSTFAAVSPRRNAARADAPILLIHGKDDTVVAFSQSSAMADALKDAGRPYELVTLKEEDHWLSRSATRQQMLEAAVGFVQRHNPADPAK